jgi:16S rRNA (cytidine1402-2'-O)-methyltransferase
MTYRAVHILSGVDLIAAEDTRTTKVLLDHYAIRTPLISYYSYNEIKRVPELIEKLKGGKSIAVVSDAGTPGISDPAFRIIRAAIDGGIRVVAVPGASALLAALVPSGLPTDSFVFEGFLPAKKGRKTALQELALEERTVVLYESPHRILRTLGELREHAGNRRVAVGRELTKKFEETFRGTLEEALAYFSSKGVKGEFVLVIEGAPPRTSRRDPA